MVKFRQGKIINICFIVCVAVLLSAPYIFAHRAIVETDASEEENRVLAPPTAVMKDGGLNHDFPAEYDKWFADHLGFRQTMINGSAWIDYYLFHRFPDSTNNMLGRTEEIVDGRSEMVSSFTHTDLLTEGQLAKLAQAYQTVSDWLNEKGIQFYVVQCVEKHEIYPESFIDGVDQCGTVSREDQIMDYLGQNTSVKYVYLKDALKRGRNQYRVYNRWADAAHWSQRGAFIGYTEVMHLICQNGNECKVLQESDYDITVEDFGETYFGRLHKEDMQERFVLKNPKAQKLEYIANVEGMIDDHRHSVWKNPEAGNNQKLLILGDSYFYMFLVEDFAESFSETWMVMGDYLEQLPQIVASYHPDIVILESAQRVNRNAKVKKLAKTVQK